MRFQFSTKEQIRKTYISAEMDKNNRMIQTGVYQLTHIFYEITLYYENTPIQIC